jgi:hypothetical protein
MLLLAVSIMTLLYAVAAAASPLQIQMSDLDNPLTTWMVEEADGHSVQTPSTCASAGVICKI